MEVKLLIGKATEQEAKYLESVRGVLDNPEYAIAVKILNTVLIGIVKDYIIEDNEVYFICDINEKYKDLVLKTQEIDFVPILKSMVK